MSQKIKKNVVLSIVLMISIVFTRCQNDDNLSNSEISNVSLAKKWFKEYESGSDNYALFQNLDYEWENAEVKETKNGVQLVIIPVTEAKKDESETWEQKLYIYKLSESNYKALLYEFYPEDTVSIDSKSFNGYISAWDLKSGFVKSAKFENDKIVENGIVAVLANDQLKFKGLTNKQDKKHLDDEDGIGEGSGTPSPIALKEVVIENNYKDPYTYLYFPRGVDTSGYSSVDYTCNYAGGGGGSTSASASGNPIMPPPPKFPISDIKKFLSCLNTAASANLTVYAEQSKLSKGNVGHAFISISQGNNIMTYGFYPENGFDKSFFGQGIMGDNGGDVYDVSGNIGQISPQQLQKIISLSVKYQNSWYDIDANNCSDFTADVLNIVGVASNNSFETPGTVSKTLEKVPNHTSNPSYAPKTKRTCL